MGSFYASRMIVKLRALLLRWTLPRCQVCRRAVEQRGVDTCDRPECVARWRDFREYSF